MSKTCPPKPGVKRMCHHCENEFYTHPSNPNGHKTKYCSDVCAKGAARKRYIETIGKLNPTHRLKLSTGETGQINEMLVSIDLLKRGYKVYLPFDTTSRFDILIEKDNKYHRVQVKTGMILPSGTKTFSQGNKRYYDILAIVYNLLEIEYQANAVL